MLVIVVLGDFSVQGNKSVARLRRYFSPPEVFILDTRLDLAGICCAAIFGL
jgi:hypothetical protein